jgi:predicted XRE-type DNA-binding protein
VIVKTTSHEADGGDVFAHCASLNDEKDLVRAQLVQRIGGVMKARGLRQVDAAKLMGATPRDVSLMLHGHLRLFSAERLLRFLVALGQDVEIVVRPRRDSRKGAQLRVSDGAVTG